MRLLALALLMGCVRKPEPPRAEHPPGSRVTCGFGAYYFERQEADGGWSEVSLILPDGGTPVRETAVSWAMIPTDAGIVRVRWVP